ncbi:transcription initiation factor tfiid subunit [Anaeramoeba flamelloides]|uniref:Transcription initiation factor tfiid subunit n=1 Tax=Anaeramoeba flamelloides TaxID=1746091 RepID=A0AAV7ZWJ5_9EUKA|nr:transcription initiation factor tfiid subunit [Anaeramoeba flamelloides]
MLSSSEFFFDINNLFDKKQEDIYAEEEILKDGQELPLTENELLSSGSFYEELEYDATLNQNITTQNDCIILNRKRSHQNLKESCVCLENCELFCDQQENKNNSKDGNKDLCFNQDKNFKLRKKNQRECSWDNCGLDYLINKNKDKTKKMDLQNQPKKEQNNFEHFLQKLTLVSNLLEKKTLAHNTTIQKQFTQQNTTKNLYSPKINTLEELQVQLNCDVLRNLTNNYLEKLYKIKNIHLEFEQEIANILVFGSPLISQCRNKIHGKISKLVVCLDQKMLNLLSHIQLHYENNGQQQKEKEKEKQKQKQKKGKKHKDKKKQKHENKHKQEKEQTQNKKIDLSSFLVDKLKNRKKKSKNKRGKMIVKKNDNKRNRYILVCKKKLKRKKRKIFSSEERTQLNLWFEKLAKTNNGPFVDKIIFQEISKDINSDFLQIQRWFGQKRNEIKKLYFEGKKSKPKWL